MGKEKIVSKITAFNAFAHKIGNCDLKIMEKKYGVCLYKNIEHCEAFVLHMYCDKCFERNNEFNERCR